MKIYRANDCPSCDYEESRDGRLKIPGFGTCCHRHGSGDDYYFAVLNFIGISSSYVRSVVAQIQK